MLPTANEGFSSVDVPDGLLRSILGVLDANKGRGRGRERGGEVFTSGDFEMAEKGEKSEESPVTG